MNIADLIERDRFPVIVVDLTRVDLSRFDLRPGGVIRCGPNALRYETQPRAIPWESARRLIEADE